MSNQYTDKIVDSMTNDLLPGRKKKVKPAKKKYSMPPTEAPLDDLVDDFPPIPESLRQQRDQEVTQLREERLRPKQKGLRDRWIERGYRQKWIDKKQATKLKHENPKRPHPVFNGAKLDHVKMTQTQYEAWCKDVVDNMQRACDFHNILVPQDTWKAFRHVWKEEFTEGLMYNDSTHGELVPIEIEKES